MEKQQIIIGLPCHYTTEAIEPIKSHNGDITAVMRFEATAQGWHIDGNIVWKWHDCLCGDYKLAIFLMVVIGGWD